MAPALTAQGRRDNRKSSTSSSTRVQVGGTVRNLKGRLVRKRATLTQAEVTLLKEEDMHRDAERRAGEEFFELKVLQNANGYTAMTAAERREEDRIRDVPDSIEEDGPDGGGNFREYEDDVLHGRVAADISHAGEDLTEEEVQYSDRNLLEELRAHHKCVLYFLTFLELQLLF
jgi:hypothetical protein